MAETLILLPIVQKLSGLNDDEKFIKDLWKFRDWTKSDRFQAEIASEMMRSIINETDNVKLWIIIYDFNKHIINHPTTPKRFNVSTNFSQTSYSFNTSNLENTTETRNNLDKLLKQELKNNFVVEPALLLHFRARVPRMEEMVATVFQKCQEGLHPLYNDESWTDWPNECLEHEVSSWIRSSTDRFLEIAQKHGFLPSTQRQWIIDPHKTIRGSQANRKLDIGIVENKRSQKSHAEKIPEMNSDRDWSDILFPGELKSNPNCSNHLSTWLDLSRYVREIFSARIMRRFVIGFTLCGSLMRLWQFDRIGAIASDDFDIHKQPLNFLIIILGFFWMSENDLGFDPTIFRSENKAYIEIAINNGIQRLC